MITYFPGTRVLVFDPRLYKNDKKTPVSFTMRSATVVNWYGMKDNYYGGNYSNLVDVVFDHDGRFSKSHFADYMKVL